MLEPVLEAMSEAAEAASEIIDDTDSDLSDSVDGSGVSVKFEGGTESSVVSLLAHLFCSRDPSTGDLLESIEEEALLNDRVFERRTEFFERVCTTERLRIYLQDTTIRRYDGCHCTGPSYILAEKLTKGLLEYVDLS
jgi:hypothetical protein